MVSTLLIFTAVGTHDIESKSRDAKGVCNDVHIVIHGQLSLEERRIFVVDVPTTYTETSASLDRGYRTPDDGSAPFRDDSIVTESLMHEV